MPMGQGRVDRDGPVSESSCRLAPRRFYPVTQPPYLGNPGPRSNHRALARATPRFWYPSKTLLTFAHLKPLGVQVGDPPSDSFHDCLPYWRPCKPVGATINDGLHTG